MPKKAPETTFQPPEWQAIELPEWAHEGKLRAEKLARQKVLSSILMIEGMLKAEGIRGWQSAIS